MKFHITGREKSELLGEGILTIIFGVIRFIKKKFKNTFISLLITTLILLVIDIIIVINT